MANKFMVKSWQILQNLKIVMLHDGVCVRVWCVSLGEWEKVVIF